MPIFAFISVCCQQFKCDSQERNRRIAWNTTFTNPVYSYERTIEIRDFESSLFNNLNKRKLKIYVIYSNKKRLSCRDCTPIILLPHECMKMKKTLKLYIINASFPASQEACHSNWLFFYQCRTLSKNNEQIFHVKMNNSSNKNVYFLSYFFLILKAAMHFYWRKVDV